MSDNEFRKHASHNCKLTAANIYTWSICTHRSATNAQLNSSLMSGKDNCLPSVCDSDDECLPAPCDSDDECLPAPALIRYSPLIHSITMNAWPFVMATLHRLVDCDARFDVRSGPVNLIHRFLFWKKMFAKIVVYFFHCVSEGLVVMGTTLKIENVLHTGVVASILHYACRNARVGGG